MSLTQKVEREEFRNAALALCNGHLMLGMEAFGVLNGIHGVYSMAAISLVMATGTATMGYNQLKRALRCSAVLNRGRSPR